MHDPRRFDVDDLLSAMARRNRRRRHDIGQEPWFLREVGGLPGWAIVAIGAILVALAAFFVIDFVTG